MNFWSFLDQHPIQSVVLLAIICITIESCLKIILWRHKLLPEEEESEE